MNTSPTLLEKNPRNRGRQWIIGTYINISTTPHILKHSPQVQVLKILRIKSFWAPHLQKRLSEINILTEEPNAKKTLLDDCQIKYNYLGI